MVDMNCQIPPAAAAKKLMNDAVNSEQQVMAEGSRGNVISVGDYDLQLSCMKLFIFSLKGLKLFFVQWNWSISKKKF
jgi:hypothetical protein